MDKHDLKADPFYCIGRIEDALESEMFDSALERLEAIRRATEEFDAARAAYIKSLEDERGAE